MTKSLIRKYNMYKAGEYIRNSHQTNINLYKILNDMDNVTDRHNIIMQLDKIGDRNEIQRDIIYCIIGIYGLVVGFCIGSIL